jgi:hypothetical protein
MTEYTFQKLITTEILPLNWREMEATYQNQNQWREQNNIHKTQP